MAYQKVHTRIYPWWWH